MQIHHIITTEVDRFVLDATLGPVKRRELVMKSSGIDHLTYANREFHRDPDGTFTVDDDVAAFFLGRKDASGSWFAGPSPFAPEVSTTEGDGSPRPRTPRKTA